MGYRVVVREWPDWLFAGLVVLVLLAGAWAMLGGLEKAGKADDDVAVAFAPEAEPVPATEASIPPPAMIAARAPAPASVVTIYECVEAGQKVLADRPCGPDATVRAIDTRALNTFTGSPMTQTQTQASGARSAASTLAGATPDLGFGASDRAKKQLCESLQDRIDYINARTRQRHTHREGEYWRAEWHKAKRAYSDARCGR